MRLSNRLNWIVALLGIWEGLAPFILGYSYDVVAVWNAILVGFGFLVFGAWSALSANPGTSRGLNWINMILGIWLILAPFVLGYAGILVGMWNAIIIGAIVALLEIWSAMSIRSVETTEM
jgi:hypothetical protein